MNTFAASLEKFFRMNKREGQLAYAFTCEYTFDSYPLDSRSLVENFKRAAPQSDT